MMRIFAVILLMAFSIRVQGQTVKKEILLIGTFHFDNPGLDIAQVNAFNIESDKSQKELEAITAKIKAYNPDKIFVEWRYNQQPQLDSLYTLFVAGEFNNFIAKSNRNKTFYKQNEIFQLAFRAAKKLNHTRVYGIDYRGTQFPFDSLMTAMNKAGQKDLRQEMENALKEYEKKTNADRSKLSLTQVMLQHNTEEYRKIDKGNYLSIFNRGGSKNEFVGPYLVSEWYRRNLYMYSLVQKITESKDKRVMVLIGAGHAAMFKEFIELDNKFKVVELKEVVK